MQDKKLQSIVGKTVQLYPHDTYSKTAIILEISDKGILFKILTSENDEYIIGSTYFINWRKEITFKVIEGDNS